MGKFCSGGVREGGVSVRIADQKAVGVTEVEQIQIRFLFNWTAAASGPDPASIQKSKSESRPPPSNRWP
jgi:hypothetical protein